MRGLRRAPEPQDEDQAGVEGTLAADAVWEGVGTLTWGAGADFRQ